MPNEDLSRIEIAVIYDCGCRVTVMGMGSYMLTGPCSKHSLMILNAEEIQARSTNAD